MRPRKFDLTSVKGSHAHQLKLGTLRVSGVMPCASVVAAIMASLAWRAALVGHMKLSKTRRRGGIRGRVRTANSRSYGALTFSRSIFAESSGNRISRPHREIHVHGVIRKHDPAFFILFQHPGRQQGMHVAMRGLDVTPDAPGGLA